MPTSIPAMRGQFGSTEFFIVTMPAKEFSERVVIPKEMPDWDELTLEERFQREINYNRVKGHIAPYLANDPDRFFGAFIVDIINGEDVVFESFSTITQGLPALYASAAKSFGFLHLQGDEVLVPLDGQHRLAALKFAITGKDEKARDIPGLSPNLDVARDTCTVILIKHDAGKARKIFNKVNRYAKATSKADNLITADDDIVAIISREEIADKLIGERLVNHESNTLTERSPQFTTLSTIYDLNVVILEEFHGKIKKDSLPSMAEQQLYRDTAKNYWDSILSGVESFRAALHDKSETGDSRRSEIRRDFTLGKPFVQKALIRSILRLQVPAEDGTRLPIKEICSRVNKVDWRVTNPLWQGILMFGDKVASGKQAELFAARFIAFLLGEKLENEELSTLRKQFANNSPGGAKSLPEPFF